MARGWAHFFGAGVLTAFATPAAAELSFCNDTGVNASIAIGYLAGDKWTSEGWWTAGPGQCVTAVDAPQPQSYYYWHAVNENGEFASDAYFFCAVDDVFTIIGDQDCEARGHERLAFSEVQIGGDGVMEVRLTEALAPKPKAARKAAEPEAAPEPETAAVVASEPVAEPEVDPAPTTVNLPQPTFKLTTDIPVADLLTSVPLDFPAVKAAVLGEWGQDGSDVSVQIGPKRFEEFENGATKAAGDWRLTATCPGHVGAGPGIVLRYDASPDEKTCLVFQDLRDDGFALRDPSGEAVISYAR